MCRWLAYSGSPLLLEDLLYKPENSLVVQSKHSQMGATTTNGDGFGVGWYGAYDTPGLFRSTEPAWNDLNLRELCAHAQAGRVFAHIRASTGSAVQQTNCHPFRHDNWLWMHNGALAGFHQMKRDLAMEVDPDLFADIEGSTDSEMFFYLALSFGLREDPRAGVARAVGLIEEVGRTHGVPFPVQMTVATTDGDSTWAFRYSSEAPRTAGTIDGRVTARGVRVRVPSCAWAMLLTMARPRPAPVWFVRMRSLPRWNGSASVATSSAVSSSPVFSTVSSTHFG